MNYLAHLYLSGNDDELKLGNFIGDSVRGSDLSMYPPRVQDGIILHRGIDRYTDSHHVVMKSKLRLRPKYHKYAPVIVDMFYDHFLGACGEIILIQHWKTSLMNVTKCSMIKLT